MSLIDNAWNRLMRAGDETSMANRKLIQAAEMLAAAIVKAIPVEWYGKDLGMDYRLRPREHYEGVFGLTKEPNTIWIGTDRGLGLWDAREIAALAANGFVAQLAAKLKKYRDDLAEDARALEYGIRLLGR